MLSSLDTLTLQFESILSHPDGERPTLPPPKRSILPALTSLDFKADTEYLEELVIGIDTPQLDRMSVSFLNKNDFDFPRVVQFINCTPTLRSLHKAL